MLYLRCLTTFNPHDYGAFSNLGQLLIYQGKYSEAIANLQQAIELNPKYPWSYYHLGRAYQQSNQFPEAIANLQQAIELNPKYPWSYYHLGLALKAQKQLPEAAAAFYRHLKFNPAHRYTYDLLAHIIDKLPEPLAIDGKNIDSSSFNDLTQALVTASNPQFYWQRNQTAGTKQPNFIIIGQQKCGTTALYSYLIKHPQILPGLKKEIHFWDFNSDITLDWYLSHFPPIAPQQNFITGEASTTYFDHPQIAAKIAEVFPETKILVLLRNPVERTISRYHMACRLSEEDRSLQEAVFERIEDISYNRDIDLVDKETDRLYFSGSQYIDKIQQWVAVFPQKQFLILKSEDMFNNPKDTVDRVFDFLELTPYQLDAYTKINSARYPSVLPSQIKALQEYFRPYNQQLEKFLDRKFDWYK